MAWAEEAETGIIVVQDLQTNKKKTLTSIESGSRTYISLSFSNDESRGLVSLVVFFSIIHKFLKKLIVFFLLQKSSFQKNKNFKLF